MPGERTTTRNYTSALVREGADATPGPRLSRDVQLVQVIDDISNLTPQLINPASTITTALSAAGASTYKCWYLSAPPGTLVALQEVTNSEGTNSCWLTLQDTNAFTFVSASAIGGLTFGPTSAVTVNQAHITINPNLYVNQILIAAGVTFDAAVVTVNPGQTLALFMASANAGLASAFTFIELPV